MDETAADLTRELDRLSLTNALVDFEVANARVTDLTQRLIDSANEIVDRRADIDRQRLRIEELDRDYNGMVASKTWKIARGIEALRRLLTSR